MELLSTFGWSDHRANVTRWDANAVEADNDAEAFYALTDTPWENSEEELWGRWWEGAFLTDSEYRQRYGCPRRSWEDLEADWSDPNLPGWR